MEEEKGEDDGMDNKKKKKMSWIENKRIEKGPIEE
jgi:hypothetical protein